MKFIIVASVLLLVGVAQADFVDDKNDAVVIEVGETSGVRDGRNLPGFVDVDNAVVPIAYKGFLYPANTMPITLSRQFGGQQGFPGFGGQGGFQGQYPGQYPGFQGQNPGFPGQFPDQSGGQYPGGQYPGGQFPGGQFPGGQYPGGQFPGGQYPQQQGPQTPQPAPAPAPVHPVQKPPSVEAVVTEGDEDNSSGSSPSQGISGECGLTRYSGLKIAGGGDALPGEFPWGVALFNRGRQFCGGSLIGPNHILTAAHCVAQMSSEDAKQVTVRLGDHNLEDPNDQPTIEKRVKLIVKNKLFSMQTLHHDVAILVLDSPVQYTKNVRPICIPSGHDNYAGEDATVSGWGLLKADGQRPRNLQKISFKVWTQQECRDTYVDGTSPAGITDHMLCAGSKGHDSCSGDSGGPMVHRRADGKLEQIGIVSWGIGCGMQHFPGVYTRVTEVRDWIEKVTSLY